MKECETELGFVLFDVSNEIIGTENSTFGKNKVAAKVIALLDKETTTEFNNNDGFK